MSAGIYKRNVPTLSKYLETRSTLSETGCIEWKGSFSNGGYGLGHHGGLKTTAHRLSYMCHKGKIKPGLEIDHICKNKICINPKHLQAISHIENVRRSSKYNQTHCIYGHEFNEENTYVKPSNGCRSCRKCNAIRSQKHRKENK